MRNVSRTHILAVDWLFDRINSDPKIQTRFVDTKNQLAYILTKGNFTHEEWNHFLRLFNIMNISQFASCHFRSTSSSQTMSKRLIQQERPGEDERVVAKSKRCRRLSFGLQHRWILVHLTARGHSKQKVRIQTVPVKWNLCRKRQRIPLVQDCPATTWRYPRTMLAILRKVYSNVRQKLGRQPGGGIYVPPRTRTSKRSNQCSVFHRNWSKIKVKKYLESIR